MCCRGLNASFCLQTPFTKQKLSEGYNSYLVEILVVDTNDDVDAELDVDTLDEVDTDDDVDALVVVGVETLEEVDPKRVVYAQRE